MRWGLVGTGPWARLVHAPSLAAHPRASLAAVWGRDPGRREALAQEFGVPAVPTLDELLERVEAVSLAVAPQAQALLAHYLLARGLSLLLEKPVSTDVAVVRELAAEVGSRGRAGVFLTRLFEPRRQAWLRGALGRGYTHADVEWISAALSPGSVYADSAWRHGEGGLWDVLPHVLAQVVPVLGDVVDASVTSWPEYRGYRVRLAHVGGGTTDVRLTLNARAEERAEWIRFDGPQGSSLSPEGPLDFVAAHGALVDAIEAGALLGGDDLLRAATVGGSIGPIGVISALVAALEPGPAGAR